MCPREQEKPEQSAPAVEDDVLLDDLLDASDDDPCVCSGCRSIPPRLCVRSTRL